jgi:hypothetical protein
LKTDPLSMQKLYMQKIYELLESFSMN